MRRHEQRARLLDERELQQAAGRAPHGSLSLRGSTLQYEDPLAQKWSCGGGGSNLLGFAFNLPKISSFLVFCLLERSVARRGPTLAT